MADELLLRSSLQRERDEIARLQSQLRQQQQSQKGPNTGTGAQQQQFLAPLAHPNRQKLDLADQQRRLLLLQQQQQQFQQQQILGREKQQHGGNGTTFASPANASPSANAGLSASSPSIPSPIPSTNTSTPSAMPSASIAAAAAFLLAQQQSKIQSLTHGSFPSQFALPLLFHSPTTPNNDFLGLIGQNHSRTLIQSPCPTPAYHYQLAAPKPIQPINLGQFADLMVQHSGGLAEGALKATSTREEKEKEGEKEEGEGLKKGKGGMEKRGASNEGGIRSRKNSSEKKEPPQQCSSQGNWWPSSTAGNGQGNKSTPGEISPPRRKSPHEVPVYQISPQQLHLAMQQFFRSQQSRGESFDSGYSTSSGGGGGNEGGGPSSPKRTAIGEERMGKSRGDSLEEEIGEEGNGQRGGGEEYVDVVGDGEPCRSSQLKLQRKAHIEFYRKLKSFRNRGDQLDCQLCQSSVPNSDASIRSHVHGHCKTALFVCKLCQRGFQDQHLVFEHIGKEHPVHRGTQFIEDRRDMGVLMDLLAECFPRVLCRARDCLFEAIGRLTASAEFQGQTQLQCRLCSLPVAAQKNALYGHLNHHPSYKCKKCKFSCTEERGQLEHQRREHPGGLELASGSAKDRAYCVSLAFDVLLDTLKCCFPFDQIGQTQSTGGKVQQEKLKVAKGGGKKPSMGEKKRRGRKRKHKDSTGTSSEDGDEIVELPEEEAEEECSWTEED